jgi:hypothetical protein
VQPLDNTEDGEPNIGEGLEQQTQESSNVSSQKSIMQMRAKRHADAIGSFEVTESK